jgi:hypothetical protein
LAGDPNFVEEEVPLDADSISQMQSSDEGAGEPVDPDPVVPTVGAN